MSQTLDSSGQPQGALASPGNEEVVNQGSGAAPSVGQGENGYDKDPLTALQMHLEKVARTYGEVLAAAAAGRPVDVEALSKALDAAVDMVNALPGAGRDEAQQMAEVRKLIEQEEAASARLAQCVKSAEGALDRVKRLRVNVARGVFGERAGTMIPAPSSSPAVPSSPTLTQSVTD